MLVRRLSEALNPTPEFQPDDPFEIIRLAAEPLRAVSEEEDAANRAQRDVRFLVATAFERELTRKYPASELPLTPFLGILRDTGIPNIPGAQFVARNFFLHAALQVAARSNVDPGGVTAAMKVALSGEYPNNSQLWAGLHHTASSRGQTDFAESLQAQFQLPSDTGSSWTRPPRTARQVHDLHVDYANQPLPTTHKPRLALGKKPTPPLSSERDAFDDILGPVAEPSPLKKAPEPTLHGVSFDILDRFFEGHGLPYFESGSELADLIFSAALSGNRAALVKIERVLQEDPFKKDFSMVFAIVEARLAYATWEMKTTGQPRSAEITFALNKAKGLIDHLFNSTHHPRKGGKGSHLSPNYPLSPDYLEDLHLLLKKVQATGDLRLLDQFSVLGAE